jgi:hypothetical protein
MFNFLVVVWYGYSIDRVPKQLGGLLVDQFVYHDEELLLN